MMSAGFLYAALYLALLGVSAGMTAALLLMPYVLLRRGQKRESWGAAIMHAYLPWLATVLVILGIFGIG